jgi:hypothetical protein
MTRPESEHHNCAAAVLLVVIFDLNQFKLLVRDYRHGLLQGESNQARPSPVAIEGAKLHHQ